MENNISILSTRKLLSNQKQFLLNAGFKVQDEDFIQIQLLTFDITAVNDFLIFTSQNAVKSIVQNENYSFLKSKKCFCVGTKTKRLLEHNGFEVVYYFDYAEELAAHIVLHFSKNSFTFFSGNLRRDTLPDAFSKANIVYKEILVYQTKLTSQKVKHQVNGILFLSPSAIESYLQENSLSNEICFCIGTTTAESLKDKTEHIQIAFEPTIESVLEAVITYYK